MIGAILLAAGQSRRFGDDKRLALLGSGQTLLETSLRNIAATVSEVLVVLRAEDNELERSLRERFPAAGIRFYCAPDSRLGMAHSLANAIARVTTWDAALICLADMPYLQASTLEQLMVTYQDHFDQQPIIQPTLQGRPGHPVLFDRSYFREISLLEGDQGAKVILQRHRDAVRKLPVEDEGILRDIDSPADL